jgi:phospholipase/carboxylesterase
MYLPRKKSAANTDHYTTQAAPALFNLSTSSRFGLIKKRVSTMSTNPPSLSLTHLTRPPKTAVEKPPLLLLLHGVGSHEHDLFSLAPYLDERFYIVSARAPIRLPQGGFGWYPVQFTSSGPKIIPETAVESQQTLLKFIRELNEAYQTDPNRIYLMGFSQGAIMSLNTMLTEPEAITGVVAMSGRLLPELKAGWVGADRLQDFPVMAVHGLYDQTLPIANGREIRDFLSTLPVKLTYREYPMAHQISDASLADIQQWLSEQLETAEA